MSAFLAYLSTNWVAIAALFGAIGHIFPTKTIANKIGSAVANTPDVQTAIVTAVAAAVTPNGVNK